MVLTGHDTVSPGPRNLITDVEGIAVGQAADMLVRTGVTVVLPDPAAVAAVDVRGGGPGSRETDLLSPGCLVDTVDAIVLSGGSAFGLAAAEGAVAWLAAQGRGFPAAGHRVPIVPAAILFDLDNGGDKAWGDRPPYRALGHAACEAAGPDHALGSAGAGYGARAGALKGGVASVSARLGDGPMVGALVAANPFGSVVMPGTAVFWAWALALGGELGPGRPPTAPAPPTLGLTRAEPLGVDPGTNTTLAVVATDAALTREELTRIATMAHDGIARAIRPAHTPFDGDIVFALATGRRVLDQPRPAHVLTLGCLAADAVARAIARAVFEAESVGNLIGYRAAMLPRVGRWPADEEG